MDISIIVPVYNVEDYLKDCVESLLYQDFSGKYEVICINDGSTDNSLSILKDYESKNSKIVVINQENKGLSGARNTGLINAKGKYIMFVDSDDYLKNNKVLAKLFHEIEKYDLDFVVADIEYDYKDKSENSRIQRNDYIKNKVMSGRHMYDIGVATNSILSVVVNKLYSKDFLVRNQIYFLENSIYEDMVFTPKVYYLAKKVKYIDEVIYMYRQREGSITRIFNVENLNSYLKVADHINQFNKEYKSTILFNSELYIYVNLIRKLNFLEDEQKKNDYKNELKKRRVVSKFLQSSKLKYKLFGLLYFIKVV